MTWPRVGFVGSARRIDREVLAPLGIVLKREEALNRFGTAGLGREQGFEAPSKLFLSTVRGAGRPIKPIERRGDFQDPGPDLEEITIQDFPSGSRLRHHGFLSSRDSSPATRTPGDLG